jgi:prepilin-type processing-associated H-X9-DG protein
MRYIGTALVLAAVVVIPGCGARVDAAQRPLASLVPADAPSYSELNLDRLLGKTAETAALREAFGNMQSLKALRAMLAENKEAAEGFDEVMEVLEGLSETVGPRVGWAVWMPDPAAMMGGMMGGMMMVPGGMPMPGAMPGMPKVLLVAEVRDSRRMEGLIAQIVGELGIASSHVDPYQGAKVMEFVEGQVALAQGDNWLALGFPGEMMKAAADRAAGKAEGGSLWEKAAYQRVLGRLPKDAVLTQYVSAQSVEQMLGMLRGFMPSVELTAPGEEGLGWAMGVRVEEKDGGKLVTAYTTADLETVPYLIDAPIALQVAMMYPMIAKSREAAQKAVCLSNIKNMSLAMQMFLADHNDEFPKTERWVEEMMPYIRNEAALKCPKDESWARSSYGMNEALIGKRLLEVEDPAKLVVFYETANPGENPVGGPEDVVSPGRHLNGNNFGYADGHAQWVPEGREVSFEVK